MLYYYRSKAGKLGDREDTLKDHEVFMAAFERFNMVCGFTDYLWIDNILMNWQYTYELTVYLWIDSTLWIDSIFMNWQYIYELRVYLWIDSILMNWQYIYELAVCLQIDSILMNWQYIYESTALGTWSYIAHTSLFSHAELCDCKTKAGSFFYVYVVSNIQISWVMYVCKFLMWYMSC